MKYEDEKRKFIADQLCQQTGDTAREKSCGQRLDFKWNSLHNQQTKGFINPTQCIISMPKVLEDIGAEEASVNTENSKISAQEICMSTVIAYNQFCEPRCRLTTEKNDSSGFASFNRSLLEPIFIRFQRCYVFFKQHYICTVLSSVAVF